MFVVLTHLLLHNEQMYTMSQAVFGVGVGGEYPIASTSASERAEADESLHAKRGETVMLTFSMQGGMLHVNLVSIGFQSRKHPCHTSTPKSSEALMLTLACERMLAISAWVGCWPHLQHVGSTSDVL